MAKSKTRTDKWASTARLSSSYHERQILPQEACVGSIAWIRQRIDGDKEITCVRPGHCNNEKIQDKGYQHPAVILKIWQRPGSTIRGDLILGISDMTTFGQASLQTYIDNQHLVKFAEAIPLYSAGEIPSPGVQQLSLSSGGVKVKSYIRLQHVWEVAIGSLWKYDRHVGSHAYSERFTETSYYELMNLLELEPDTWESVEELLGTARERLQGLVDQERVRIYKEASAQRANRSAYDEMGNWIPGSSGKCMTTPSFAPTPSNWPSTEAQIAHQSSVEHRYYATTIAPTCASPGSQYTMGTYLTTVMPPIISYHQPFDQSFTASPNTNSTTVFLHTYQEPLKAVAHNSAPIYTPTYDPPNVNCYTATTPSFPEEKDPYAIKYVQTHHPPAPRPSADYPYSLDPGSSFAILPIETYSTTEHQRHPQRPVTGEPSYSIRIPYSTNPRSSFAVPSNLNYSTSPEQQEYNKRQASSHTFSYDEISGHPSSIRPSAPQIER